MSKTGRTHIELHILMLDRCGALSDRIGRNMAIVFAGLWGILGQALEASAFNAPWMLCARILAGVGTGGISAVIPVWSSELVAHDARGMVMAFEMVVNFAGISASCEPATSVAQQLSRASYVVADVRIDWIEYLLAFANNGHTQVRWRCELLKFLECSDMF